jgi:O-antigen/teichoic acid export membrane protein
MNGGIGAAIATFITEIFIFGMALYLIPGKYLKTFKPAYIIKPVAAGAVMAAFIWLLRSLHLYWMLLAGAGMICYLAALYFLKLFDEDEIELLKQMAHPGKIKGMLHSKKADPPVEVVSEE